MNDGWVKLHRKIMDSPYWHNPKLFQLSTYLIMKASHKEHSQFIGNIKVDLERGQFTTGRFVLGRDLRCKPTTAWKRLQVLQRDRFCDIKSNTKFSIITVINYDYYQGSDTDKEQQNGQQSDNKVTTNGQQSDTNNNDKNDKNVKKEQKPEFLALSILLKTNILKNNPKANITELQVSKWSDIVKIMVEKDKIDIKDIETAINNAGADKKEGTGKEWQGWSKVIRSMDKVKKHYNELIDLKIKPTQSDNPEEKYKNLR